MKKIWILILALAVFHGAFAQQHRSKDNMTITIYEPDGQPRQAFQIVVTRTDSAQLQKDVDRSALRKAKKKDQLAVHEALLQSFIQPYIDRGWQLVATSVEGSVAGSLGSESDVDHIYRYYLSKQK